MKKPESKRPAFPGRFPKMKTFSDERGVSPVIAVILMVAITVVLASVLYVMVTSIIIKPPDQDWGRLDCAKDDDEPGKYTVTYTGSRNHDDVEISVIDYSIPQSMVLDPETETHKEIPDGISLTYMDVNMNNKLDGVDILVINGGEDGDKFSVADKDGNNVVNCELE
jgi:flagellin-like protein